MHTRQTGILIGLAVVAGMVVAGWPIATAGKGDPLAKRFQQYDRDGDGKVSAAELPSPKVFRLLDRDGDGMVTLQETRDAVAAGALRGVRVPEPAASARTPTPIESAGGESAGGESAGGESAGEEDREESSGTGGGAIRQGPKLLKPGEHGVGRYIADVAFTDLNGDSHRLSDFSDRKALVIAMTGTGCPLCQKYAPSLAALERRYRDRDVAFLFVNPNTSESRDELEQAIRTHGFQSPYVRDDEDRLTRVLKASTTTEAFVLDAARTLVYRGAVDDQYGFAYALEGPRETYLADALDAVLAGRRPELAATSSPGCDLFYDEDDEEASAGRATEITWHNRVSRIVQNNCLECHREGGLAPFPLETREAARDYAGMIRNVLKRGVMPPWFAASPDRQDADDAEGSEDAALHWANDRSMSDADRKDLLAWIKAGVPEGDPADAPLPREFPDEWMIGEPDTVLQLPDPISVKATGRMPYKYVRIKTDFPEDRWVQAVEVQPTSRPVVHHVLVFVQEGKRGNAAIDERSGFFAAYVPGNSYQRYPQGLAKKLPAGATLVFQLHYTPNGTATTDQTRVGLDFADEPPEHLVRNVGIANSRISIPPHAANHPEKARLDVPADVKLLAFMPHMHLRGKAIRYDLVLPDGKQQELLDVPRYDFNWQLEYRLAQPLFVRQGSRIEVTGWYDNSENNPANPDPTKTVKWGPQTEDEMLIGYVEYYIPEETAEHIADASPARRPADQRRTRLERAFHRADRNNDGQVTADEFPREGLFKRLDENTDGILTLKEVQSAAPRLRRE